MVQIDRICKSFGPIRAVDGVSLELRPGAITGLLGVNGAGKSTLIRMVCGYLNPDTGRIVVHGRDTVQSPAEARAAVGYLPESAALYPEMPTQAYLRYRAELFGIPRRDRARAVDTALAACMLEPVRRQRIGTLSKGFRQRVGLAAAVLHDPPVLVLDEPTSGLDPRQQAQIRALLRSLSTNKVILFSSHILPEVEALCDRVVIMARGRIRADGTPAALAASATPDGTYDVEFAPGTNRAAAEALLRSIPGVTSVLPRALANTGWLVSAVSPTLDLRPSIAAAAAAGGLLITELHRPRPTLETLFAATIREDDAPAQEAPRAA